MRSGIIISLMILISNFALAEQLSVEALIRESRVSNTLSDRFKSLRLMMFLKEKRMDSFYKDGSQEYLESLFRLAPIKSFINECSILSKIKKNKYRDGILYTCSKLLIESFSLQKAQEYLYAIDENSEYSIPASLLLASLYLGDSDGEKCLKTLNTKLITKIKNANTKDLYFITRARCLVEMNQMDKSILQYQQISPSSSYYFDALEETAWAQFKIRRLESARTLLDVLITTYETGLAEGRAISAASYFRSRYLQSYIELVERNNNRAEQQFRALKDSITKYSKDNQYNEASIKKLAQRIVDENPNWIDTKAISKDISSFLDLVKTWGDNRIRKRLDHLIDYQFSLAREIKRLKDEPLAEFQAYLKNLLDLEEKNKLALEDEMLRANRSIERVLRVIRIKAELGSIEIVWSQRAEGVRSIGELLETYQKEVDEVEDYFSNL